MWVKEFGRVTVVRWSDHPCPYMVSRRLVKMTAQARPMTWKKGEPSMAGMATATDIDVGIQGIVAKRKT